MIKIQDTVRDIICADEEALYAMSKGFMNLSAYAQQIQSTVETITKKDVKVSGIVVALSRIQKGLKGVHPFIQDIKINNITTKSPITELVFEKTSSVIDRLSSLYKKVKTSNDDFLTLMLSTNEVTIICSDRIRDSVLKHVGEKPRLMQGKLASIGISFDPKYYEMPNITFSLLRRIARKKIVLAETLSTHTEVIFIFHQKDLPEIMGLFEIR